METKKLIRFFLPFLLSALVTWALYSFEQKRTMSERGEFGLRLARQAVVQIEFLKNRAVLRTETDPLEWAIQTMTVGPEFRPIQISRLHSDIHDTTPDAEKFHLNRKSGVFTYYKIINSENNEGLKIQVSLGYSGFLGAKTLFVNDLMVSLFFVLVTVLGFVFLKIIWADQSKVEFAVLAWADEAQDALIKIGINVKDVTRDAQVLACAAAQSRNRLHSLLEDTPSFLKAMSQEMENSIQSGGKDLFKLDELVRQMKDFAERTDHDLTAASQSFDQVFSVTEGLNGLITKTKESLVKEAKLIQNLKDGFSG